MAKQPTTKQDGADDLVILHPDRQMVIAGVSVTMREYGHVEGLRLHALITPIVDGFKAIALSGELAGSLGARVVTAAWVVPLGSSSDDACAVTSNRRCSSAMS